jgi:hypothetical protein
MRRHPATLSSGSLFNRAAEGADYGFLEAEECGCDGYEFAGHVCWLRESEADLVARVCDAALDPFHQGREEEILPDYNLDAVILKLIQNSAELARTF